MDHVHLYLLVAPGNAHVDELSCMWGSCLAALAGDHVNKPAGQGPSPLISASTIAVIAIAICFLHYLVSGPVTLSTACPCRRLIHSYPPSRCPTQSLL